MKALKRFLGFFLCLALLIPMIPTEVFAADHDVYTLSDDYIEVNVSRVNGGFLVSTVQGNRLKKSDNNKELLYRNGQYDTSFVSFRIGEGEAARDYIFGGSYPGKNSTAVTVTQTSDSIAASWGVEGITFTQTISLAAQNSENSGMVSISLAVSGTAETVKARILLDTCLGDQDYGYYQVSTGTLSNTLQTEQDLTDPLEISNFYAVDDFADPAIQARMVSTPSRVSVGHWNHLASSLYEFVPKATLNFTNSINEYQTADSACALYYDLRATDPVNLYYGVYSNWDVLDTQRMAVNLSAPQRLNLNGERTAFVPQAGMPAGGAADFAVHVSAENYVSETSRAYKNVIMTVNSTSGLCPLDDNGKELEDAAFGVADGSGFSNPLPLVVSYGSDTAPVQEGDLLEKTLFFKAKLQTDASFERVTIAFYDNTAGDFSADSPLTENLLGVRVIYILVPGNDGDVPKVHFTAMSPKTVYHEGVRHLYVSVANADLMETALVSGKCLIYAVSADGSQSVKLDENSVTFRDGVADVVLSGEDSLSLGSWHLELRWTDAAVSEGIVTEAFQNQTAQVLEFAVSNDPKYRNDSYGVIAAVKYGSTGIASTDDTYRYELRAFKDEADFTQFSQKKGAYTEEKYTEILLVYRGAFVGDRRYPVTDSQGKIVGYRYYTAVSKETVKDGKSSVDNTITINNCLDFEAGTISVYYEDYAKSETAAKESPILCEFDGKLYTSVERSSVWTGMAALTKLEKGQNFSLIKYDKNGVRKGNDASATPITLIWPNIYGYGQKLAGMVFKLAYGQFGVMYDGTKELGRVIAFSASLNLKFMKSPQQEDDTAVPDTYFGRMKELWTDWRGASIYQYAYHGNRFEKLTDIGMNDSTEEHQKAQQGVAASVMVPDILFGCGEGFVGLHFSVEITIQNMIDSLPKIKGKLEVNTIGDWSFGLSGSCKLEKFSMEAKLSFKSRDNIPIPDEIYFFIGGFTPGINVDGCGTLWLKGLGGGISNIYDTIFMTSGLPPLKLTVAAAFSIVQVLDGKAKLELSLSGIKLSAEDLKIADTIEVIRSITLGLQWYPDLDLQASIYVDMFEKTICGNGYIVLIGKNYKDWAFEMFARVRLCIPESVPAVGGMTLLGIDVGIGTKKVWGAFTALCITLGVTYYWGESGVHFGTGGDFAQPSYPSLLTLNGYEGDNTDIPIGYDEETDRVLYARIGTNLDPPVGAQILSEGDLRLLAAGEKGVWSNLEKTGHKFNLGDYDTDNLSTLVQVNFPAEDLEDAKAAAAAFAVNSAADGSGTALSLTYPQPVPAQTEGESDEAYEARIAGTVSANLNANANITYNPDTKLGTFAFTLTDSSQFGMDWYLSTGVAADVVLYNVHAVPEINSLNVWYDPDDDTYNLDWDGVDVWELDTVSFTLCRSDSDPLETGVPLGVSNGGTNAYFRVPVDLPTGDYYIRAVYSAEDMVNGVFWTPDTIHYDNPRTPAPMGTPSAAPCGDLKFAVSIPAAADANTTGYIVEVLNADGSPTELSELRVDRAIADDGTPMATTFTAGGSLTMQVPKDPEDPDAGYDSVTTGLTGGQSYRLRITPFHGVEAHEEELPSGYTVEYNGAVVYGTAYTTDVMLLPEAVTPTVTLTGGGKTLTSVAQAQKLDAADPDLEPLTFTGSSLTLTASFSEAVTGTWTLDGSDTWNAWDGEDPSRIPEEAPDPILGSFSGSTATIRLEDLADGSHLLTLTGKSDARGDGFAAEYAFNVDTLPPRLMLQAPLNGSPFNEDGTVTVSGITDPFCTLHISVDGGAESTYMFISPLDEGAGMRLTADGWFSVDVDIPEADQSLYHYVTIWIEDGCGNASEPVLIQVSQPGSGKLTEYALQVNGTVPEGGGVSTVSGITDAQLAVVGVIVQDDGTKTYFPVDNDLVQWRSYAAEGDVSVSPDGVLNCAISSKGFAEARIQVSTGAYRTALLALVTDAVPGDLNGDNKVSTLDLVRLQRYLLDTTGTVTLCASGDLNADGRVNIKDLVHLKKYLLFEDVELH